MGKNLDSDRKFFCVTCFHVVRAVRCADSLFSRLDGYSGQSGQIQNAQMINGMKSSGKKRDNLGSIGKDFRWECNSIAESATKKEGNQPSFFVV